MSGARLEVRFANALSESLLVCFGDRSDDIGGGVAGCGGSDGPPDLTVYFKTTPYANASCNAVDQRLAGVRPMRLYTNGNVALPPTTQGLASYYQRHALSFFDGHGAAVDDDGLRARHRQHLSGPRARRGVSGRRPQRRGGLDGVGSGHLQPGRDLRRQLSAEADDRLREHAQRQRRRRDEPGGGHEPGTSGRRPDQRPGDVAGRPVDLAGAAGRVRAHDAGRGRHLAGREPARPTSRR